MTCKLCKSREADKTNTHCLTDGIIRSALNFDGGSSSKRDRNKGLYYDFSTDSPFIGFGFQQSTPIEKVLKELGREPTDEEIEAAKKIPYAVDYCFCSKCEAHFGVIEDRFMSLVVIPRFRSADLSNVTEILLPEAALTNLFFYLQLWRSAVCLDGFSLPGEVAERLRLIILGYDSMLDEEIRQFPLSVTYMETSGGNFKYTENLVGFTSGKNPYLLFMNDLIVQFFESYEDIKKLDFHGLNDEDYRMYTNPVGEDFIVKIFSDSKRKGFLRSILETNVELKTKQIREGFTRAWIMVTRMDPPVELVDEFMTFVATSDKEPGVPYTEEMIVSKTREFISNKLA